VIKTGSVDAGLRRSLRETGVLREAVVLQEAVVLWETVVLQESAVFQETAVRGELTKPVRLRDALVR